MIESVVRPRKSNFTKPAASADLRSNDTTGIDSFESQCTGTSWCSGLSPITTPAACMLTSRTRPSIPMALRSNTVNLGSLSIFSRNSGTSA